jgi:hypothetical protein
MAAFRKHQMIRDSPYDRDIRSENRDVRRFRLSSGFMLSGSLVDWARLRAINGAWDVAFEGLCQQLVGAECVAGGGTWIAKGKIDAGVEGCGVMPDGGEWGVQAKWFRNSPTTAQWRQVDVTEVYSPRNAWGAGQRVTDEFPPMHPKALRLQGPRATDAEM